ncbi:MAG: SRPBCC family protein, partial [Pseudomonadota bacterium]
DANLKITMHGPSHGIGSGFAFDGKDGTGTQTIIAMEENKSVTMQIDLGAMGKPVTQFRLAPMDGKTEVTWSTKSDFGFNPVGRVFGLFLDGMLGPDYELGLRELNKAAQAA